MPSAVVIDGKAIAATIRGELKAELEEILKKQQTCEGQAPLVPGLSVIILGERKDSQTYVKLKHQAAAEVGFKSTNIEMPEDTKQEDLEAQVIQLNNDPSVHGILIQLPLPKHINEPQVLELVSPMKDVDGLHPINIGLLNMKSREPHFKPCTPSGVIELLDRMKVQIEGKRAVVIGRSNIVGMPVAQLLTQRNATVTVCHSRTVNTEAIVREADIVVAAAGQPELIRGSWIKPGAAVIDVGTNPVTDASKKAGFRLVGDCHYEEVSQVAACVTPVPGGVGPMTIAMLLSNTLKSFKKSTLAGQAKHE